MHFHRVLFGLLVLSPVACAEPVDRAPPEARPPAAAAEPNVPANRPAPPPPAAPAPPTRPWEPAPPEQIADDGAPDGGDMMDGCDPARVQWLLGQPRDAEALERARGEAGARVARYIAHDEMVTMEYDETRLNALLDEAGRVRDVTCG